jgi:hypothetical protein
MITRLHRLPLEDLQPLLQEAKAAGFRFLERLRDDWASGANRFDRDGEAIYGYYVDDCLVAIGGINRQSPGCGRLRRFYVAMDSRRRGIGRALVLHILAHATQFFDEVVLHTETAAADAFYRAAGFSRIAESEDITHRMKLKRPNHVA